MSELKPVAKVSSGGYVNGQSFRMYNIQPIHGLESNLKVGQFLFAIPEGYTIVPIEPTDEILDVMFDSYTNTGSTEEIYKAMIEASKAEK